MFTYYYKSHEINGNTILKEIKLEEANATCFLMLDAKGKRTYKGYANLNSAASARRYYFAKYDKENTGAAAIIYEII